MTISDDSSLFICAQTAALLTGKTDRTIINWLESGAIKGKTVHARHLPRGQVWKIDLFSMAKHIPTELTSEFMESVKNAEAGDAQETTNVATYFYKPDTYKIALNWFELAAKRGNADAMNWLWDSYFHGYGVEPDFAVAIQWLGKAAKQGSMMAQATVEELRKIETVLREQQKANHNAILEDIKRLANRNNTHGKHREAFIDDISN
ncbi:tetratricopeptide repeat protein [Acidithiobacillus sp.]|uniref:tetratricopeptide repeat protein n=1 Tax=Acidithiobacillus sp. TaxID=1872118 RepID=UPI003CFDD0C6